MPERQMEKLIIDCYIPEGYVLSKNSTKTEIILDNNFLEYSINIILKGYRKEDKFIDPILNSIQGQDKIDFKTMNKEDGILQKDFIYDLSCATLLYDKAGEDDKDIYVYKIAINEIDIIFDNEEKMKEIYNKIKNWFKNK
jgi:hypothetical protein